MSALNPASSPPWTVTKLTVGVNAQRSAPMKAIGSEINLHNRRNKRMHVQAFNAIETTAKMRKARIFDMPERENTGMQTNIQSG